MGRYYEEFEAGQRYETPRRTVIAADISQFAGLTADFNPLHMDEVFAAQSDFAGRGKAGILLQRAFVNIGGNGFEGNAGIGKQHLPRAALRGEDQRLVSAPDGHRSRVIPEAAAAGDR